MNHDYFDDLFRARTTIGSIDLAWDPEPLVHLRVEASDTNSRLCKAILVIFSASKRLEVPGATQWLQKQLGGSGIWNVAISLLETTDVEAKFPDIFALEPRALIDNLRRIGSYSAEDTSAYFDESLLPYEVRDRISQWGECGTYRPASNSRSPGMVYTGKLVSIETVPREVSGSSKEYMMMKLGRGFLDHATAQLPNVMHAHFVRSLAAMEMLIFVDQAQRFARCHKFVLAFEASLISLWNRNIRTGPDGKPDIAKIVRAVESFVDREAAWKWLSKEHYGSDFSMVGRIAGALAGISRFGGISDRLDGLQFEKEVADALSDAGFIVSATPPTGDFGADLIAEKFGLRYAVQCKDLAAPAGVKAVQEVEAARKYYRCDFAVVACPTGFSRAANELASELRVELFSDDFGNRMGGIR